MEKKKTSKLKIDRIKVMWYYNAIDIKFCYGVINNEKNDLNDF